MQRTLPEPGFGMAIVLVLIALALQVFFSMPLSVIDIALGAANHAPLHLNREPLALAMVNILALSGAIWFGLYLNRLRPPEAFPWEPVSAGQVLGIICSMLGLAILLSEADNLFRWFVPAPRFLDELLGDVFAENGSVLSRAFLLVIVAPVTEELLFRGIILRGLLRRHRPIVALTLSALLFSALHLNPWQFISTFVIGIIAGWFFLRTGSIWLCVLAHAVNNGLFTVVLSLPVEIPGLTELPGRGVQQFQPLWLDALGLLFAAVGLLVFRQATRNTAVYAGPPPPTIASESPVPPVITV